MGTTTQILGYCSVLRGLAIGFPFVVRNDMVCSAFFDHSLATCKLTEGHFGLSKTSLQHIH